MATTTECVPDASASTSCDSVPSRTAFSATITFNSQTADYTAVISTMFLVFTVGGKVEADGTLVMIGDGVQNVTGFRSTPTEWRLRADANMLTGTFRFPFGFTTRNARLDYVSLNGTLPIPADARFGVSIERATVRRSPEGFPVYEMCVGLTNASSVGVTVSSSILVPIASNGDEYAIEQLNPQVLTLPPRASLLSPCFRAQDRAVRQFTPSLRLVLDLIYDDQVAGPFAVTRPLTVLP